MKEPFWEVELIDGSVVRLNLNFGSLYALRESPEREIYDNYSRIRGKKEVDELDAAYIVYTGYVCANMNSHLPFEEFIGLLPPDRSAVNHAIDMMLEPKKKQDLLNRLRSTLLQESRK